jgi:hypothetical protein
MNGISIRIAFLTLVILFCCAWSVWMLSSRPENSAETIPVIRLYEPRVLDQSGF